MPPIKWGQLFVFTVSPVELFIRGTIVYLVIFVLMRVFRREAGTVGIADLLMVVLIADASQNAMSSDYSSVLDGFVLILTIVFWNYAVDWLTARSPLIERFTHPAPIALVREGSMIPENMSRQFVTHSQLMSILREHGIENMSEVKAAYIEGSGHTSVIPMQDSQNKNTDESNEHRRLA
jgi:uncharacterized membrane protein YcaP (DUF421 family)